MTHTPNIIWAALMAKLAARDRSTFALMLNMAGVDEALRLLNQRWLKQQTGS